MDRVVGGEHRLALGDRSARRGTGCVVGEGRHDTGVCETVLLSESVRDLQLGLDSAGADVE